MLMGIGAYPGSAIYDPGRPSWLPYWLASPTEVLRQFRLLPLEEIPEPGQPVAPVVPGGWETGVTDPEAVLKIQQETMEQQREQTQEFFTGVAEGQLGITDPSWFDEYKWYILGTGGLLLVGAAAGLFSGVARR